MRAVAVVGVFAFGAFCACGETPGAYFEIHGSSSLAKVSVYIGQDPCMDPSGAPCAIAPPMLDRIHPATPGGTWFRDIDTQFTSSASGGVARIHIEATRPNEIVQLVVLGLDAQGAPIQDALVHDVAVPQGTSKQVTLTLTDSITVTSNNERGAPHADGDYVLDWTNTGAPSDCVLVEHWQGGTGERVFVVPSEDPDCDGVLTLDSTGNKNPLECDAYWFESSSQLASGQASCATPGHINSASACLLGGDGCIDGTGPTGTCSQIDPTTCVPDAVCNSVCAKPAATATLSTCVASAPAGPMIHCLIYAMADSGLPCAQIDVTNPTHGQLQLDSLLGNSSRTCKQVSFAPIDSLYVGGNLKSMKLFAPSTSTAELDVGGPLAGGNCGFDMRWMGGAFAIAMTPQHAVADIELDNDNHLRLPVLLDYAACTQAPAGQVDGFLCYAPTVSDGILNCAR